MTDGTGQPGSPGGGLLLSAALHHLREQEDAVQVDELLGEGDVPGQAGQVLQGFQLGVHAGRLDAFVELLGVLGLPKAKTEETTRRKISVPSTRNKDTEAQGTRPHVHHATAGFPAIAAPPAGHIRSFTVGMSQLPSFAEPRFPSLAEKSFPRNRTGVAVRRGKRGTCLPFKSNFYPHTTESFLLR